MTEKTEIDITWLARWFRVLWWFPFRYLFFFYTIPGIYIAANYLSTISANSTTNTDYSTILHTVNIVILLSITVFPVLGLIGFFMIGRMNRLGLSITIPLIIAAATPFVISMVNGNISDYYLAVYNEPWKLFFEIDLLLPIIGPILIIASSFLITIKYSDRKHKWYPFAQEHIFQAGFRNASLARLKIFALTALSLLICVMVFNVLLTAADQTIASMLKLKFHEAANQFVWYATTDPRTANGYFSLMFSSKKASTFFFANLLWMAVSATIAVLVFRYFLRFIRRFNAKIWRSDPRPPILLLRSFSDDSATVWPTALFRQITRQRYRLEEAITGELSELGPVIGIGQPGETLPKLGAYREELDDDKWQARVLELMDYSQLIVLIAGTTQWVRWELRQALERGHRDKLMIVFPNVDPLDKTARVENIIKEIQNFSGIDEQSPDRSDRLLLMHSSANNGQIYISSHKAKQSDYQFASRLAAIQKNTSGLTLGSTKEKKRDAGGIALSRFARRSLIAITWILALTVAGVGLTRPNISHFFEPTCEKLAGAPWDRQSSGNVLVNHIDPQPAIRACRKALKQDPGNPRHQFHLGRALIADNKISTARKYFESAARQGYGAAMNNLGLIILNDQTLNKATRHLQALHWLSKAVENKIPLGTLGRSQVYAASPALDPTGLKSAANLLLAVSAGVFDARSQLIGGLKSFGYSGREIFALERILKDFNLFDENPDKQFTFETLQSAAIFFSSEVSYDLQKECLTVRNIKRCYGAEALVSPIPKP